MFSLSPILSSSYDLQQDAPIVPQQCVYILRCHVTIVVYVPLCVSHSASFSRRLRDKGEDDKMPPIRKKQRGLLLKLQQEQVNNTTCCYTNSVAVTPVKTVSFSVHSQLLQ